MADQSPSSFASSSSYSHSSSSAGAASASVESYVGSLISLTSKSDIRYEGVLFSIDPQESTIALQNVRSYGTEGRKKDGSQVPPSDKVYDYILFRGSDIKDLQVKSSPPVNAEPHLHRDPAIIQSNYSQAPSASATSSLVGGRMLTDLGSHAAHTALTRPHFPNSLGSYQTGAHLDAWVSSPAPPNAMVASLSASMYWPGCIGASSSIPHTQQQSVPFQPLSTLPFHSTLQNPLQYPEVHSHVTTSMPNLSELSATFAFSTNTTPTQFATSNSSNVSSSPSNNSSLLSHPSSSLPFNSLTISPVASSNQYFNAIGNLVSNRIEPDPVSTHPISSLPYSSSSLLGPTSGPLLTVPPPLLTPDQLTWSGSAARSSQNIRPEPKDMETLLPTSSKLSSVVPSLPSEAPLLPLPVPSQQPQRSVNSFTEEFDFMSMNEKFNKDEVWGSLGKAKQISSTRDGTEVKPSNDSMEGVGGYDHAQKFDSKPVYNKDDFFDSLSCNSLNRGARSGRAKFSERMKLDTETFGVFEQRPHLGRGNRGPLNGGNFRGSYNRGRGNVYYGGRGRGGYAPI